MNQGRSLKSMDFTVGRNFLSQLDECMQKYGAPDAWKACCDVFDHLNVAAVSGFG